MELRHDPLSLMAACKPLVYPTVAELAAALKLAEHVCRKGVFASPVAAQHTLRTLAMGLGVDAADIAFLLALPAADVRSWFAGESVPDPEAVVVIAGALLARVSGGQLGGHLKGRLASTSPTDVLLRELKARAYQYREAGFTLSSGTRSSHYVDGKQVLCTHEGAVAFARWFEDTLFPVHKTIDAVGGLELGGALAAMTITTYSLRNVRAFAVRKQSKEHGTRSRIEGALAHGDRVVIIEDVVTTGKSAMQAIDAVTAFGGEVIAVAALLDRQEVRVPGFARYPVYAPVTLASLLALVDA